MSSNAVTNKYVREHSRVPQAALLPVLPQDLPCSLLQAATSLSTQCNTAESFLKRTQLLKIEFVIYLFTASHL